MTYIYLIIAGVLGYFFGRKLARRHNAKLGFAEMSKDEVEKAQKESKEALGERTADRKEKILEMLKEANEDFSAGCNLREGENKAGITREDVEKLLEVSGITAHKYLNELEEERKIEQVGSIGRGVYYVLSK